MWEQVQETVNYIKAKTNFTPEYGVILGSGLGGFTEDIQIEFTLSYNEIPIGNMMQGFSNSNELV